MSAKLQNILELLSDGEFHELEELQMKTELNEKQTRTIVEFLTEYGFAEMHHENEKVRINKSTRNLLEKTTI